MRKKRINRIAVVSLSIIFITACIFVKGLNDFSEWNAPYKEPKSIITMESISRKHQVELFAVGEPDFPFGKQSIRVKVYGETLFDFDYDNDSGALKKESCTAEWGDNFVILCFTSNSHAPLLFKILFEENGSRWERISE